MADHTAGLLDRDGELAAVAAGAAVALRSQDRGATFRPGQQVGA